MIELAIATRISPAVWRDEDDAAIATALEVLDELAEARKRR